MKRESYGFYLENKIEKYLYVNNNVESINSFFKSDIIFFKK